MYWLKTAHKYFPVAFSTDYFIAIPQPLRTTGWLVANHASIKCNDYVKSPSETTRFIALIYIKLYEELDPQPIYNISGNTHYE